MKILKYIFLLILLCFVALSVFVATQKSDYEIVRTKIIKSPKSTIYNYVLDYKNWEQFGSWKQDDPNMKFIYPAITSGKGSSYSWKGKDGDGNMKTIFTKENESISQKMEFNGSPSEVFWSFKDTLGKTKVTWRNKGKMDFPTKIYSTFVGGIDKLVGSMYERSLDNLDKTLDFEINTYKITVNGEVQKTVGFYLKKTINSLDVNLAKNIKILIPNLSKFMSENKIIANGKPFIIYNSSDLIKKTTVFSVGFPIKDEIFTSSESENMSGNLLPFQAIKTTLVGDSSHEKEALRKTYDFISKNNLTVEKLDFYYVFYTKSNSEVKNPSKWVTEIFVPLRPKYVAPKTYKPVVKEEVAAPEKIPTEFSTP